MKRAVVLLGLMALAACGDSGAGEAARPDFRAALDAHLAAIEARDIEAYKQTVTGGDGLMLVFPDGETVDTTEGVVGFHEEWFQDPNWRWDGEVVKIMEGEDMAAAFMTYDYRDTPQGEPRSSWLVLLFALEEGEWRVIHDQNTRITQTTNSEAE